MISGAMIADKLAVMLEALPPYDPQVMPGVETLPRTMRELIDGDWNFDDWDDDAESCGHHLYHLGRRGLLEPGFNLAGPLALPPQQIGRGIAPLYGFDYRHLAPLMRLYWRWLGRYQAEKQQEQILDELLGDDWTNWQLTAMLVEEVNERGFGLLDLCPQIENEESGGGCFIYDNFQYNNLPEGSTGEDYFILLELLENIARDAESFNLPQICYELFESEKVNRATEILREIVWSGQWERLETCHAEWGKALKFVMGYDGPFYSEDYDDLIFYYGEQPSGEEFYQFFVKQQQLTHYHRAIKDLLEQCSIDAERFWTQFIDDLLEVKDE